MHKRQEEKLANTVTYILNKAPNKEMELTKLEILFYLASREYYNRHDFPICDDEVYATKNGPIHMETHRILVEGKKHLPIWDNILNIEKDNIVRLTRPITEEDIWEINEAERATIDEVFIQFAKKDLHNELLPYVKRLPEWKEKSEKEIDKTPLQITPNEIMKALGKSEDRIKTFVEYINQRKRWKNQFPDSY